MWLTLFLLVAALVAFGGWWYWRRRRQSRKQLISLVALLREPMTLDPAVLAKTAGRVWDADLGDGDSEGTDGIVAAIAPHNAVMTIMHDSSFYLIHCNSGPYVEDVESAASSVADMRIRQLFSEHRAWFSCDLLGVDNRVAEADLTAGYRKLARLFAEFLDENCLLIWVPQSERAYPINEDTEQALQSDDPLSALQATMTVPMVEVSPDDPMLKAAVAKARETWPQFVAAFEARDAESYSVKAPVSQAGVTEFIWVSVTALEGPHIYGTLANDPVNLGSLKLGAKVSVRLDELNDWAYLDAAGDMHGCHTLAAMKAAAKRPRKS